MKKLLVVIILASTLSCSRKKGEDAIPSQSFLNVQGTYSGSFTSNRSSGNTAVLTLAQNAQVITGSFSVNNGAASGSVSGTAGTSSFAFTLTQTVPCSGTVTGNGTISGNVMSSTFSGSDCFGVILNGVGVASKV